MYKCPCCTNVGMKSIRGMKVCESFLVVVRGEYLDIAAGKQVSLEQCMLCIIL